ncbi:MAG: copper-binding protein [Pseudomonadota bacterium]|jgi:Cu(I)/Ag(I) efflux system protein CusF|nr:copper-binding protein [Rubrivivax sp.]MCA3257363.1 copper-binding protein [Rubrivivax sp.]MCE2913153.1 copper-binding protein [Rubrivivax sp.]MCZ8031853.1 copper-binding protein [Rubrivivax sp.]
MNRTPTLVLALALHAAAATALTLVAVRPAAAQAAPVAPVAGEVTKLDKAGNRIEIRHGEIRHLDMPPMKMMFRVRDPKLLEGVAVGDRIRFTAEKIDGNFTVTAIAKGP